MKTNAMVRRLALGLVVLMAVGGATVASAKPKDSSFLGIWRLESRQQGQGWGQGNGYRDRDGEWGGRDQRGSSQYGQNGQESPWEYRQNGQRGSSQYGRNGQRGGARLPETFRIDRDRRQLQVETMDGRELRELHSARNNQLTSHRSVNGRTIVDTFSLTDRGRRLVVRTIVRGPQGTREMSRTYHRA